MPTDQLKINEIFYSIQGESSYAGQACFFVRLRGCHLRCVYCDTEYAFHEGDSMSFQSIQEEMDRLSTQCKLVQVTGGEPLLQKQVHPFMTQLADAGYKVLIETSGACDISVCDPRVIRIMDFKTPCSGEMKKNHWENIHHLKPQDELKFVLMGKDDYDWAKALIQEHQLQDRVHAIHFSAVNEVPPGKELPGATGLNPRDLAEWILADDLPVRFQTQLHKIIWPASLRGV